MAAIIPGNGGIYENCPQTVKEGFMKKKLILIIVLIIYGIFAFAKGKSDYNNNNNKVVIKALAYGDESNQEGQNWIRIVEEFERVLNTNRRKMRKWWMR